MTDKPNFNHMQKTKLFIVKSNIYLAFNKNILFVIYKQHRYSYLLQHFEKLKVCWSLFKLPSGIFCNLKEMG